MKSKTNSLPGASVYSRLVRTRNNAVAVIDEVLLCYIREFEILHENRSISVDDNSDSDFDNAVLELRRSMVEELSTDLCNVFEVEIDEMFDEMESERKVY